MIKKRFLNFTLKLLLYPYSDSEKTAIDKRIEELKRKKEEILREMSAHACDVMVCKFNFYRNEYGYNRIKWFDVIS